VPGLAEGERGRVLRFERLDVVIALSLAGLVNLAMLAVAARLFHTPGLSALTTIGQAHAQLGRMAGGLAALAFAAALLASGASSASVGTYAGDVVVAGFVRLRVPLLARRAITMIPALAILAAGVNPASALVLSQVVLSFGIPFALGAPGHADQPPRRHGRPRQPAPHGDRRVGLRRRDHRAQRLPAAPAVSGPVRYPGGAASRRRRP
jgi:hypothetical protein